MRMRLGLLVCCLVLSACASEDWAVRERAEAPSVFLPAELLEWELWDEEAWDEEAWSVYFVEAEPAGGVEPVMARRPMRRGGRGGPGAHNPSILEDRGRE